MKSTILATLVLFGTLLTQVPTADAAVTSIPFIAAWYTPDGGTVSVGNEFVPLFGDSSSRNAETDAVSLAPFDFNATDFRVNANEADCGGLAAGQSFSFALRKNGADTTLTGSCADGAAQNSVTLDTDTVTVAAGDRLTIRVTLTGGVLAVPLRVGISMRGYTDHAIGEQGSPGVNSLIANTAEAAGTNCATGGVKVTTGLDNGDGGGTAGDGTLQAGEVDATFYVCNGASPGLKYTYLTNTAATDPGSGNLKFNANPPSGATVLRISETDGDSRNIGAWIETWEDTVNTDGEAGVLLMQKDSNPAIFRVFAMGTGTDMGTWQSIFIADRAGSGTFANNDVVRIQFMQRGNEGLEGAEGMDAGTEWHATASNADCSTVLGAGNIRFNTATTVSVTHLCVGETDADAKNVAAWVQSWDDSTTAPNHGQLIVRDDLDDAFAVFTITSVSDLGDRDQINVAYVTHTGTFSESTSGESVLVQFSRTGDLGATGPEGPMGAPGEGSNLTARQFFGPVEESGLVSVYVQVDDMGTPRDVVGDMTINITRVLPPSTYEVLVDATMDHVATGLYRYDWPSFEGRFNIRTHGLHPNGTADSNNPILVTEDGVIIQATDFEVQVGLTGLELGILLALIALGLAVNARGRDLGAKVAGAVIILIVAFVAVEIRNLWVGGVEFALVVFILAGYAFLRAVLDYLTEKKATDAKKMDPGQL